MEHVLPHIPNLLGGQNCCGIPALSLDVDLHGLMRVDRGVVPVPMGRDERRLLHGQGGAIDRRDLRCALERPVAVLVFAFLAFGPLELCRHSAPERRLYSGVDRNRTDLERDGEGHGAGITGSRHKTLNEVRTANGAQRSDRRSRSAGGRRCRRKGSRDEQVHPTKITDPGNSSWAFLARFLNIGQKEV